MFSLKKREKRDVRLPKNLTKAQYREVQRIVEKAKRDDGIPRTAQQSIPFQRMFPDGICRVTDSYYTKTIRFQDINYQLATQEDQKSMSDKKVIGKCPHCGAEVIERQKSWSCSNRECKFALWKDNAFFRSIGKTLTASMAEKLLADGRIRLSNCESKKTGKTYDADLVLQTEADGSARFSLAFEKEGKSKWPITSRKAIRPSMRK